jgi:hypothetical protein
MYAVFWFAFLSDWKDIIADSPKGLIFCVNATMFERIIHGLECNAFTVLQNLFKLWGTILNKAYRTGNMKNLKDVEETEVVNTSHKLLWRKHYDVSNCIIANKTLCGTLENLINMCRKNCISNNLGYTATAQNCN